MDALATHARLEALQLVPRVQDVQAVRLALHRWHPGNLRAQALVGLGAGLRHARLEALQLVPRAQVMHAVRLALQRWHPGNLRAHALVGRGAGLGRQARRAPLHS